MSTSRQALPSFAALSLAPRSVGWQVTFTLWAARIFARAASRSAALRELRWRWQPSAASACATPKPMPREAPVMRAVRPVSLRSMGWSGELIGGRERRAILLYPPGDTPRTHAMAVNRRPAGALLA